MVADTENKNKELSEEEYEYEYIEVPEGEELPFEDGEYEYEYVEVEVPNDESNAEDVASEKSFQQEEINPVEVAGEENYFQDNENIEFENSEIKTAETIEAKTEKTIHSEIDVLPPKEDVNVEAIKHEEDFPIQEIDIDSLYSEEEIIEEPAEKLDEISLKKVLDSNLDEEDEKIFDFDVETDLSSTDDFDFDFDFFDKIEDDTSNLPFLEKPVLAENTKGISKNILNEDEKSLEDDVVLLDESVEEKELETKNNKKIESSKKIETQSDVKGTKKKELTSKEIEQNNDIDSSIFEEFSSDEHNGKNIENPIPFTEDNNEGVDFEGLSFEADNSADVVEKEDSNKDTANEEKEIIGVQQLDETKSEDNGLIPVIPIVSETPSIPQVESQTKIKEKQFVLPRNNNPLTGQDVRFDVEEISDEEYSSIYDFAKIISSSDGISTYFTTKKKDSLYIADSEFIENGLKSWNLIVLDRKIMSLNSEGENFFPQTKNSVRIAKLIKNGVERIGFFNQEEYNPLPKTDDFGMFEGKFIAGIDQDSGLIINDFINIDLVPYAGKKITFVTPITGMLVGPKGGITYFSNLERLYIGREKEVRIPKYDCDSGCVFISGKSSDVFYEISGKDEEKEISGDNKIQALRINVGVNSYGWNVMFDNDVVMSMRDLMTYQTRNGCLPSQNGKVIYGRKTFDFKNIKRIVLYELPQYFSYGK